MMPVVVHASVPFLYQETVFALASTAMPMTSFIQKLVKAVMTPLVFAMFVPQWVYVQKYHAPGWMYPPKLSAVVASANQAVPLYEFGLLVKPMSYSAETVEL